MSDNILILAAGMTADMTADVTAVSDNILIIAADMISPGMFTTPRLTTAGR